MRALFLTALLATGIQLRSGTTDGAQIWSSCCMADGGMQVCVGNTCHVVEQRWQLRVYVPTTYNVDVVAASVVLHGFKSNQECEAAGKSATYWARGMYPPDARGVVGVPAFMCSMDWPR